MVEVLLKLAWTKHSRAPSVLSLPPLLRLLFHSTIIPCTGSAHLPFPAGRVTSWVPSLYIVGAWNGPSGNSRSFSQPPACASLSFNHGHPQNLHPLGNWFSLRLTRTSLEPTEMRMQIVAEFCVVFLPLSCAFKQLSLEGKRNQKAN